MNETENKLKIPHIVPHIKKGQMSNPKTSNSHKSLSENCKSVSEKFPIQANQRKYDE